MASFFVQSFLCTSCHMSLASNSHTFLLSFSSGKTSHLFLDLCDVQRSDLHHQTYHDQIALQQLILFLGYQTSHDQIALQQLILFIGQYFFHV